MDMNIRKILSLLLARAKYIILIALVFAIFSFGYTKLYVAEKYTSSAKFLVVMDTEFGKTSEASFVKEAVHSYLEIFNTTKFFTEVADIYNSTYANPLSASQLKSMTRMQSSSNKEAPAFSITVSSSNPQTAYDVSKTVADGILEKSLQYEALNKIDLIDDPKLPLLPSSPNIPNNTAIGFFAGAIASAALFIFFEMLNNKIKNLEDITEAYTIPILGVVPDTTEETRAKQIKLDKEDR